MSKKPRGRPVLMEQERPMRRPGQRPYKRVIRDEFLTCASSEGCSNIVSVVGKPEGYSGPVYCALHRDTA